MAPDEPDINNLPPDFDEVHAGEIWPASAPVRVDYFNDLGPDDGLPALLVRVIRLASVRAAMLAIAIDMLAERERAIASLHGQLAALKIELKRYTAAATIGRAA